MPVFVYRGTERVYPESCDSYGVPLGTVKPGDVLRLDQAPDQFWAPYEDGEPSSGPEPPREMRAPYTYLGSDDRRYMDYADASTGRMLEVTPGGGDGGVYDVVRRDPAFPLPPGDGRWGPASPHEWSALTEAGAAQDAAAETPAGPGSVLPSLPGESGEHEPETPESGDGGVAAPSTEE